MQEQYEQWELGFSGCFSTLGTLLVCTEMYLYPPLKPLMCSYQTFPLEVYKKV